MTCGQHRLYKGRKVKIYDIRDKFLGIGKYIGFEKIGGICNTPKFRLGRKVIRGYECWWIPLSVAKKIEKEKNNE